MTENKRDNTKRIFDDRATVIYVGAPIFEDPLRKQGIEVVLVRWRPPREQRSEINALLNKYLKE